MKIFKGKVVSVKMTDTIVVEVARRTPHPLYKKLLKRSSKFKVSAPGNTLSVGDIVSIVETRPISKEVHFKIMETKTPTGSKPSVKKETVSKSAAVEAEVAIEKKGKAKK